MTQESTESAAISLSTADLDQDDLMFLDQVRGVLTLIEEALERESQDGDPGLVDLWTDLKALLFPVDEREEKTYTYAAESAGLPKIVWYQRFKRPSKVDPLGYDKVTVRSKATATSWRNHCGRKRGWDLEDGLVRQRPSDCKRCPKRKRCPEPR